MTYHRIFKWFWLVSSVLGAIIFVVETAQHSGISNSVGWLGLATGSLALHYFHTLKLKE